jgi:hypothetical protein
MTSFNDRRVSHVKCHIIIQQKWTRTYSRQNTSHGLVVCLGLTF